MKTLFLKREYFPKGTLGFLYDDNFDCVTVEKPWLDNQKEISCIPAGEYLVKIRNSSINKKAGLDVAYELQQVSNRANIEIHVANYPTDVKGCIGLGLSKIYNDTTLMVTNSVFTVQQFYRYMNNEDFILRIQP